jgi:hypothetical protein
MNNLDGDGVDKNVINTELDIDSKDISSAVSATNSIDLPNEVELKNDNSPNNNSEVFALDGAVDVKDQISGNDNRSPNLDDSVKVESIGFMRSMKLLVLHPVKFIERCGMRHPYFYFAVFVIGLATSIAKMMNGAAISGGDLSEVITSNIVMAVLMAIFYGAMYVVIGSIFYTIGLALSGYSYDKKKKQRPLYAFGYTTPIMAIFIYFALLLRCFTLPFYPEASLVAVVLLSFIGVVVTQFVLYLLARSYYNTKRIRSIIFIIIVPLLFFSFSFFSAMDSMENNTMNKEASEVDFIYESFNSGIAVDSDALESELAKITYDYLIEVSDFNDNYQEKISKFDDFNVTNVDDYTSLEIMSRKKYNFGIVCKSDDRMYDDKILLHEKYLDKFASVESSEFLVSFMDGYKKGKDNLLNKKRASADSCEAHNNFYSFIIKNHLNIDVEDGVVYFETDDLAEEFNNIVGLLPK